MEKMFETAIRNQVRWDSSIGPLSIEQVYQLPLRPRRSNQPSLDDVSVLALAELRDAEGDVRSLVQTAGRTKAAELAHLKVALLRHIIDTKEAERSAERTRKNTAQEVAELEDALRQLRRAEILSDPAKIEARLAELREGGSASEPKVDK